MAETTAVATSGPTPGFLLEPSAGGIAARDLLEILSLKLSICTCRCFHSCHRRSNRRRMRTVSLSLGSRSELLSYVEQPI